MSAPKVFIENNQLACHQLSQLLNKQEAWLSERNRAMAAWVSFAKCNLETIFCGHYRSLFNHCDVIGLQSYRVR